MTDRVLIRTGPGGSIVRWAAMAPEANHVSYHAVRRVDGRMVDAAVFPSLKGAEHFIEYGQLVCPLLDEMQPST